MKQSGAGTLLVGIMVLAANLAYSQDYPSKPVRFWTSNPGGGTDLLARVLANAITGPLGQPVIVENRPIIRSIETVVKSPPDGYNVVVGSNSAWIGPLMGNMPYDTVRDLAPVSVIANGTNLLIVHPSLPVKSIKDLIALARARPGEINYVTGSVGSASHIAAELFKSAAKINMQHIPYSSSGGNIPVISGEVHMQMGSVASAAEDIRSGRVRALAVTTARRSQLVPQVPTVAESGLPGFESATVNAVLAPIQTPPAIVQRLNQEIVRAIDTPKLKQQLLNAGLEPASSTPEQLGATIKTEVAAVSKLIKDGVIKSTK